MANRLAPDNTQGQANWADIDDDDEDWAPETITWTDGTKTTLPQAEEHPPPPPPPPPVVEPAPVEVKEKPRLFDKPKSPAPTSAASPSTKSSSLASGKVVLKGSSSDKLTLVAKPPAPPTPVKSPWATLPPVDKVSPVVTDLPAGQNNSRPQNRDPTSVYNSHTPPPTKEIAADDFNRSAWRDGSGNSNSQLYNSHSGRYEPVTDRRGSLRNEPPSRHPAVLQRPSQQDQPEPSPAFQTSRTVQEGPFGRRRGSSNVSGGSGYLQRAGKPLDHPMPPPELLGARRGSLAGSVDSPVSPRNFSPSGLQGGPRLSSNQPWQPRSSPGTTHANPSYAGQGPDPRSTQQAVPAVRPEDDYQYQKKLMRERLELAKQRKLEEEAQEEAARRERLRLKIEALGPAPERKSAKKETSLKDEPTPTEDSTPMADSVSQPRRPSTGANETSSTTTDSDAYGRNAKAILDDSGSPTTASQSRQLNAQDSQQNYPWDSSTTSTWVTGSQQSLRNVWGSPNNDRGLGNGTFNTDLRGVPDSRVTRLPQGQGNSGPTPIAPPISSRHAQDAPGSSAQQSSQAASRPPKYPPGSGREYNEVQNKWAASVLSGDTSIREEKQARKAERDRQLDERGLTVDEIQPAIKETWRQVNIGPNATRTAGKERDVTIRHESHTRPAGGPWEQQLEVKGSTMASHTTAPGVLANQGGTSMLPPGGSSASSQGRPSRFFPSKDVRLDSVAPTEPERPDSPTPPPPTMDGHPVYDGDASHPHVSLPRPQPVVKLPPSSAPVHMPATAPTPSTTSAANSAAKRDPAFSWANPGQFREGSTAPLTSPRATTHSNPSSSHRTQEQVVQEEWQNRINNLLTGRKASPPKNIGVDSTSKNVLDHANARAPAAVSLPNTPTPFRTYINQHGATSKPMAEECFEEQEMGSLPIIRIPHQVPDAAWQPALAQTKQLPKKFLVTLATSREPHYFPYEISGSGNVLLVRFPGMDVPIPVTIPFTRTRSNPRRSGHSRPGPRHPGSSSGQRGGGGGNGGSGRSRESSGAYSGENTSGSGSTPTSRSGRGGFRGRSENWSRHNTPTSLPA
jgi:hypothetical protein